MFYKVFGSFIVITFFYTRQNKQTHTFQTTEYIDIWDDLYDLDNK